MYRLEYFRTAGAQSFLESRDHIPARIVMDTDAPGLFHADPALSLFYDFDFFFHGSPSYPIPGKGSKDNEGQRIFNLETFYLIL
jgi:hypothetical protein